ncbi:hypothetical protein [Nocardia vermiculata]|uniref:Uncharacterized protein n=1 Tax=Nocardia vermiculata TaxID=257274 RepID=A0A846Y007_9NOCA|nr:hypothetical protein [Nocardia vermiculata]NKY51422.1 hypothetical protein [Nocardia vermiculata]
MAAPDIDYGRLAAARAQDFLHSQWDERGLPRTLVSVSAAMDAARPATEGRQVLLREFGRDIGFDLGDERFTASLALAHLPDGDTADRSLGAQLGEVVKSGRDEANRFGFFFDANGFPADSDCTGMAVGALYDRGLISTGELVEFGRELLASATPATGPADEPGVVMVYWQDRAEPGKLRRGPTYDAVACANALYVLKHAVTHGLPDPDGVVAATTGYVADHLRSGRYRGGTRYYPRPEPFLHAMSRLCASFDDIAAECGAELARALSASDAPEQVPALDLALTILAVDNLGGDAHQRWRRDVLVAQQDGSGSWPASAYFRMGRLPLYWGSSTLTAVFAAGALA